MYNNPQGRKRKRRDYQVIADNVVSEEREREREREHGDNSAARIRWRKSANVGLILIAVSLMVGALVAIAAT